MSAVEAENSTFVVGIFRCLQSPCIFRSVFCRDIAFAIVRLDAEEVTGDGEIQLKEGVVGISRDELLQFVEREV